MNKIYNNLTMENLIKTEHFKSMNREQRKEIIENSSWFFQFHYYKQEEISSGIDKGVDISIYAKMNITGSKWQKLEKD